MILQKVKNQGIFNAKKNLLLSLVFGNQMHGKKNGTKSSKL